MNVFEAVKQAVTTRQAAEYYGIRVNRSGMAVCPFHNDKNPSMKCDNRFHCFGCGADGDVIDFAARLHGIGKYEAAVKLAENFGIPYDRRGHDPPKKKNFRRRRPRDEKQAFEQVERHTFRILSDYYHLLRRWRKEYAPHQPDEEWHPLFVEALQKESYIEYLLDTLLSGSVNDRADLILNCEKEVRKLERRMEQPAAPDQAGHEGCRRQETAAA